jgi:hypothetical protein
MAPIEYGFQKMVELDPKAYFPRLQPRLR